MTHRATIGLFDSDVRQDSSPLSDCHLFAWWRSPATFSRRRRRGAKSPCAPRKNVGGGTVTYLESAALSGLSWRVVQLGICGYVSRVHLNRLSHQNKAWEVGAESIHLDFSSTTFLLVCCATV